MFICGENWLKYLPWSLPFSPAFSLSTNTDIFPHSAWHPQIYYLGSLFCLRGSCLEMILTTRFWSVEVQQFWRYCCQALHWQLLMLKGGLLGPPFCLWARMHLAEAITKAFMPLRSKAFPGPW